jgi:hypothetical protein
MKKPLALIVYIFAITLLSACAITIIVKLIFWPPCTQTGNICVVDGWSIAGLAASILGVSATVLAILGAVGVAGWWIWLNDRVKNLITKLYEDQKLEIKKNVDGILEDQRMKVNKNVDDILKDQQQKIESRIENIQTALLPLENKVEQSQTRIEAFNETLDDFEESITKSFAAMGPLLAEPVAQRAIGTKRFPTFPFYMTISYLNLIKQENKLLVLEREIASYKEGISHMQLRTGSNVDLSNSAIRSEVENHRKSVLSYFDAFNSPSLSIGLILGDYRRTLYWWKAARDNQPKTPSLKPEDFDNVQKEVDRYSTRMEKAKQDFDKLKSDARSLLSHIDNLLRKYQ